MANSVDPDQTAPSAEDIFRCIFFLGALRVNCVVAVCILYLLLMVPWVGLWSVIVEFPGHTHLKKILYNTICQLTVQNSLSTSVVWLQP